MLISAATSPPFVKACLDQAAPAPGRPFRKRRHRLHPARRDREGGIDPIRRPIGFVLRGAHHAENIRLSAAPSLDQAALAAAYAAENWTEVDRLVSDDVVRRHAACGTPDQVRAKLDEYRAIGLDEVIIGGMDDAPSIAAVLKPRLGDGMKFSISLPTGFEGVMYPIPFVEPADFVRMAQAVREARLPFGVGQRPHHRASTTCASCIPTRRRTSTSC